jgi:hypothetical protein
LSVGRWSVLLMVFLTSPCSSHRPSNPRAGFPAERGPEYGPGAEVLPPGAVPRSDVDPVPCPAGQGSDPVVGPGGGHGGIDLAGVIVDDTLNTRPDLEEVTCDDDKQILPLTGGPVLPELLYGSAC